MVTNASSAAGRKIFRLAHARRDGALQFSPCRFFLRGSHLARARHRSGDSGLGPERKERVIMTSWRERIDAAKQPRAGIFVQGFSKRDRTQDRASILPSDHTTSHPVVSSAS